MNLPGIFLVDDSRNCLDSVAAFLSMQACVGVGECALSADEAMSKLAAFAPDIMLMDVAMPGLNGLHAARRVKSRPCAPKVVIVTSHDWPEYRAGAEVAGRNGFAVKDQFVEFIGVLIRELAVEPETRERLIECHSSSVECPVMMEPYMSSHKWMT